jgi:dTDP-L-rhamnose 4-epimerase
MRTVVTGGAGFIGGPVVRELTTAGHDVLVLDSLRTDAHHDGGAGTRARLNGTGVGLAVGDVRDLDFVTGHLDGADAVVHLAAKVGLGARFDDIDDYVSSNALGTAVLLRACAATGVRRFVQASSMVVYGDGQYSCEAHGLVRAGPRTPAALAAGQFEPPCPHCGAALTPIEVDENVAADPRNTYAATKVMQEQLATVWARETNSSVVSLRLHNVYGPGLPRDTPYAGVAAIFASAIDRGESPRVFEDGGQRRDFVHVDDVAGAFVAALTATTRSGLRPPAAVEGSHAAYNVGSGVVTTALGMAAALAAAAGGPPPVLTGEYRLGDVRHIVASSVRISNALGWSARVPLEDGVRDLSGLAVPPEQ